MVAAATLALAGCGGGAEPPAAAPDGAVPTDAPSTPHAPSTPGAPSAGPAGQGAERGHVVIVVFENKAYRQVAGDRDAPYLNGLMTGAAVFADAHGVAHPSQPNYLALFSGSTQGVTDDHCPVRASGPNLAQQLLAAGRSFTGYAEDLPAAGYRGCSKGQYAAKHNPWADFDNVPASADQPFTAWPADPAALPTVAFVVPNMCDDMHDCSIRNGDDWARQHLDAYRRWASDHDSLLVVTFDENDGSAGNQILTLVTGAGVRPGVRTESVNHYSVLRTVEDRYGLLPLGGAAKAAPLPLS